MASSKQPIVGSEPFPSKTYHIIALLFTTALSITLLTIKNQRFTDSAVVLVRRHRTNVQIIVQIVSHTAGFLQLYALRTIFSFFLRLRIRRATMRLEKLSLWTAIASSQVDLNLSLYYLVICLLMVIFTIIPGALWTGALTPVTVSTELLVGTINVPRFTMNSAKVWNSQFEILGPNMGLWNLINNCQQGVQDQRGFFPTCPVPALQPLLLLSARTATTIDNSPRLHAKLDNPQWTYIGRSYGVGSIPDLSTNATVNGAETYYYVEHGYVPNVTCIKNSTSAFAIHLEETGVGADGLAAYSASGPLPNEPPGVHEYFPIITFNDDYSEILAWAARSINGQNSIAIATGRQNYTILNQTQCDVTFTPTTFNVSVNPILKTIAVSIIQTSSVINIDPTGNLTTNVIDSLNLLSRMSGTLYQPVLGDALSLNIVNMNHSLSLQDPSRTNSINDDEEAALLGSAASFTAIVDDILVAYGASQVINAQDTTTMPATGNVEAVRVGASIYIYLVFALNSLIFIAVFVEAARTRCWAQLSKFNPLDIKSVIVSASAGGEELARMLAMWCRTEGLRGWDGDARCAGLRNLEVGVAEGERGAGMILIGGVESIGHGGFEMTDNKPPDGFGREPGGVGVTDGEKGYGNASSNGFPVAAAMGRAPSRQSESAPLVGNNEVVW